MRTIKELQNRKIEIEKMSRHDLTMREIRKLEKEMTMLIFSIQYLETNPALEFIESEIERLENEMQLHDKRWSTWLATNGMKYESVDKAKSAYRSEIKYSLTKSRIKYLKFLVS